MRAIPGEAAGLLDAGNLKRQRNGRKRSRIGKYPVGCCMLPFMRFIGKDCADSLSISKKTKLIELPYFASGAFGFNYQYLS